jgi:hypothetical protein
MRVHISRDYDEKGVNETLAAFMALPEARAKHRPGLSTFSNPPNL